MLVVKNKSPYLFQTRSFGLAANASAIPPPPGGGIADAFAANPNENKTKFIAGRLSARGPTPYPFIYHFGRKGAPFIYFLLKKGTAFTYLPVTPSYE